MPELPEVESVRRLLAAQIVGAEIVDAYSPQDGTLRFPSPPEAFLKALLLPGFRIAGVRRRAKYLLLDLAHGTQGPHGNSEFDEMTTATLAVHLKMRGLIRVERSETEPGPYLCSALVLQDGREIRYYDMWRWGGWWLLQSEADLKFVPGLADLGIEPLAPEFTVEAFSESLKRKRGKIKPTLLDQKTLAGLGNIYADESLNRAGIHPERRTESLSHKEIVALHDAIVSVLTEAVDQGGAYAVEAARNETHFEDFGFTYAPKVYDRPGEPCPRCGTGLVKFRLQGRGTTFCPNCQQGADTPEGKSKFIPVRAERS